METVAVRSDTSVGVSQTEVLDTRDTSEAPVLRLRLKKPKSDRKVGWREGTVDNENMGKKKSKCCCIYRKPYAFGESSSEDDEECEHCFGHPEKRRRNMKKHHDHDHAGHEHSEYSGGDENNEPDGPSCSWTPRGTGTLVSAVNETEENQPPAPEAGLGGGPDGDRHGLAPPSNSAN